MLKIGFIQASGNDSRSYGIPLAFGYLISALRSEGGQPFDYRVTAEPYDLIEYEPDLIGIGSVTSTFWQAEEFAELFRTRLPQAKLVLGGHHISALPHRLPRTIDVGVLGEGEDTFADLLRRFRPGLGWTADECRKIPGICYHGTGGGVEHTGRRALRQDLDTLPLPVRTTDNRHLSHAKDPTSSAEAVIFTSRGCPFRCAYCSTQRYWESYRRFSAAYVVRELQHIAESAPQVRSVYILDDLYVADRRRLREMAKLLDDAGLNRRLTFHGFVRSNLVDEELCGLLKQMNVRAIRFGAESGSDAVLQRMERGGKCTVATHQRAIDLAHQHGMACGASFMLGYPGETREDLQKTFDFIRRNEGRMFVEGFYLTVPLPGTELWDWASKKGYVNETMDWRRLNLSFDNPDFDWDNFLYLNEQALPRREFVRSVLESGILPEAAVERGRSPQSGDLARERMVEVLRSLAAQGARRVALYGAGRHTRRLQDHLIEAPVEVVGVLDDNAALHGTHLGPFPICGPSDVGKLSVDAVILSSDQWEDRLWEQRGPFEQLGIPVWRLYGAGNRQEQASCRA
jgi:radical SAM superfamily enzyme YgiQ (UPF0313 family)